MLKHELVNLRRGSMKREDLEWLAKQPASIFTGGKNLELLKNWNSLQNTPPKAYEFTTVCHHGYFRIIKFIESSFPNNLVQHGDSVQFKDNPELPFYAWIKHDKDKFQTPVDIDDPDKGVHVHFYFKFKNQRSFKSVANELEIPVTMLNKVKYGTRAVLEYLTHENAPDKFHYSQEDIHANFPVLKAIEEAEDNRFDSRQLWYDYRDMRLGKLSYEDFYERYKGVIVRQSFSHHLRMAEVCFNAASFGQDISSRYYSARDKP